VGAAWALFYAYFFWARVDWPPPLQGLAFAALPATLAALIVYPQLQLMHLRQNIALLDWRMFLGGLEETRLGGLLLGHALFGLTVGAIYTHPVGYSVTRRPSPPRKVKGPHKRSESVPPNRHGFIFATGIECSYPTLRNGTHRVDELEATGHYRRWREDLQLTRELDIRYLRYGIPYHRTSTGPGRYDWSFPDEVLPEMRRLEIEPILDLCHFGMPDWLGNSFQNPEFPRAFAGYARAFAERYPWVRIYTPVNEIFICAKFSARCGWWNEQGQNDRTFLTAIRHLARASLQAMKEILAARADAVFIQSESSEYTHSVCGCSDACERAEWENQVRFLPLDLLYCHEVRADVHAWLMENGMPEEEYRWFMSHDLHGRCVMGNDYYAANERILQHDGSIAEVGEILGWYLVTREYYDRYRKPVMHTETNPRGKCDEVHWLWKQWQNLLCMRAQGIPVLGFTWYSLTDQVDWDTELRETAGRVNPWGLYDLDRKIRPVGEAYRDLIREFSGLSLLPHSDSLGLV
jgi:beta-glucosidase/6-phospho-beta-glucosidase/beta-galactosidase